MAVPLHPKRHRVMTRNWAREPEARAQENLQYRTRYGQGLPRPPSTMLRNMRQQEAFRRTQSE
jgi:hypothetical protein